MTQTIESAPALDSVDHITDRCDACSAAAKLRFELASGGSLAFCGHHANRNVRDIVRLATRVVVESDFDWRGRALQGD